VVQAEYAYNQLGQQITRRLTQTGVTIHSVYGPDGNRIAEYNEATGALIRQYVWLEGAPIAVVEGGVISFVRSDHIGRPVFATNASGVKVWTAAYLPFGGVRVSTGTPPTARFPGQWFQSETGLHQNWMRDYDPTTGRYMQADPLGLVDGASVYGYALLNPGRHIDPTGEDVAAVTPTVWATAGAMCLADGPIPIGEVAAALFIAGVVLFSTPTEACGCEAEPPPPPLDCPAQWRWAYSKCGDLLSEPNPPRGQTGGYGTILECARGFVTQNCGGNAIDWGQD
jgi:RHS repeat-associated protein